MEQNKLTFYDDWYVFEDMLLCAFRYAVGRHTYVVDEACDFFEKNSHLISKRMLLVMKNDLDEQIENYEKFASDSANARIDLDTLKNFKSFLGEVEKGFEWNENDKGCSWDETDKSTK